MLSDLFILRGAAGHIRSDNGTEFVAKLVRERIVAGGEEFLVLLSQTSLEDAVRVSERLRAAVADAAIPSGLEQGKIVTVSVGVAAGVVNDTLKTTDRVADADHALYSAKHAGRNQIPPFLEAGAPERPNSLQMPDLRRSGTRR